MVKKKLFAGHSRFVGRRWLAAGLLLGLALALVPQAGAVAARRAPPARAAVLERLGLAGSSASLSPSCPGAPCQVITATTGFQAAITGRHNAMVVQRPGRVTSWSLVLASLTPEQTAYFTRVSHGPAKAGIVILHQGAAYRFRVTDASPIVVLAPYFGRTMTLDLARPLLVSPGDVVALSVPTWAPALAVALDHASAWRASRARGACADLFKSTAQTATGALTKYQCVYHTARLTYGATVADDAPAPAAPRRPHPPGRAPKKPPATPR